MIPGHVRKQAQTVAWRLDWMARTYGIERLLAVHPTTVEPWAWPKLTRQWNNLWTKRLSKHYADYLLVPEHSPEGRLHAHAVLVAKKDIRSGYDFQAREAAKRRGEKARWRTGANCALRTEMKRWNSGKFDESLRRWMGKGVQLPYGFGYTRIEPVKSSGGFARYMAKYMTKGFEHRRPEDKGRRLIRCSQRVARVRAPRVGIGAWLWDTKLASFLALNGLADKAALREKAGKRWAWDLGRVIWGTPLLEYPGIEWDDIGGNRVSVPGGRVAWRDGEVLTQKETWATAVRYSSKNAEVRFGCLNGWKYRFERRIIERILREPDGTNRYVPVGPYVSEWGPKGNGLVLRRDLSNIWSFPVPRHGDADLAQSSFGMGDPVCVGPSRVECRQEMQRRVLRSIRENPF